MLDIDMLIKLAHASVATALSSIVFPVPSGPKSNIPLHGRYKKGWLDPCFARCVNWENKYNIIEQQNNVRK
jgi:hypothetical protein